MLGIEVLIDVLVEFLIGAGRFGSVQVAATRDVAIGCVEVQCARDSLEVENW